MGLILASATLLIFFGEGYAGWRECIRSPWLTAMPAGAAFMENVLPLGRFRDLFSGGLMRVANLGVALAVTGGFTQLFLEVMEEARAPDQADDLREGDA